VTLQVPDEDWVSARVEKARHEREMALAAVKASRPWRVIQSLRGLVGRKW